MEISSPTETKIKIQKIIDAKEKSNFPQTGEGFGIGENLQTTAEYYAKLRGATIPGASDIEKATAVVVENSNNPNKPK